MSEKVTIDLLIGDEETMRVEAYTTPTPGLVVHRQVAYVPAKEEHKFTSKWQVTHQSSGKALLKPSECLPTKTAASAVAQRLDNHDWSEEFKRDSKAHKDMLEALATVDTDATDDHDEIRRYIVRRGDSGYDVIDTETDTAVENHVHRGIAGERAKEMNEKVSL